MRFIKEICIIFGFTMAGEILNNVLPFPVPAGVYGLFLLLAALCLKIVKLKDLEATGNFLLDTMPMMFIPVSVGLLESVEEIKAFWFPFLAITVISTVIVMTVTGKVTDLVIKKSQKGEDRNG